jgi:hypothetical protein
MKRRLEFFEWEVATDGYRWARNRPFLSAEEERSINLREVFLETWDRAPEKAHDRERLFLVPANENFRRRRGMGKVYSPLTEFPTLFSKFAALEPTKTAFAEFASAYGLLGVGILIDLGEKSGEPLYRWRDEWMRLAAIVDLLAAIRDRDLPTLEKWIHMEERGAFFERNDTRVQSRGPIVGPSFVRPHLWDAVQRLTREDALLHLAREWVRTRVNGNLHGSRGSETSTVARITDGDEPGQFEFSLVPVTLLACMWFQCARMLTDSPDFRSCEWCRTWFEVSLDGRRQSAKFCKDACKVAAYRARKAGTSTVQKGKTR